MKHSIFLQMNELLPNDKLPIGDWEEFVLDIASRKLDRGRTTRRLRSSLKVLKRA